MKIDTEKSEVEILKGILDEDWPKIRQAVIETHTHELAVETEQLLRAKGFKRIAEEQSYLFPGSGVSNLIARR